MPKEKTVVSNSSPFGLVEDGSSSVRAGGVVAGTRLLTPDGYRPVNTLQAGDPVRALLGRGPMFTPILWIGCRDVILSNLDRSNRPVRIRKDALADGVPSRDVFVAPDHSICLEGRLFHASDLINGRSIVLDDSRRSRTRQYWAVILPCHNTLLADNMPIESVLPASATVFADAAGDPPDLDALFVASRHDRERMQTPARAVKPNVFV
jgi:hypothetical protein